MQFKRIEEIESLPANTMLDVVGILESAGDFVTLTLKNATEQTKRSIVLRDNSNRSIELTLWGEFASNPGDQLAQVSTSMYNNIRVFCLSFCHPSCACCVPLWHLWIAMHCLMSPHMTSLLFLSALYERMSCVPDLFGVISRHHFDDVFGDTCL